MQLSTDKKDRKQKTILTTNSYKKSRFCSFCEKSDHYQLIICEEFEKADVASRWKFVVDKKLCTCCLFGNHKTSYCKKKQLCNINGCKSKHNTLLHNPDNISQNSHKNTPSIEMNYHARHLESTENSVSLEIVPVTLEGPNGTIETCAFCDGASTITIIEEEIANVLGCVGEKESLTMKWTDDTIRKESGSRKVSVRIKGKHENKQFTIRNARTMKHLRLARQTINVQNSRDDYRFMKDINIGSFLDMKPTILIGQDNWPLINGRYVVYENWNGPALLKTWLG
ncbi:hypothetical protein JTB14_010090 [Gonioctena quinquepunctata]|nr:hypothetical protein JTB14_010090 [Gonioctena quinquepunctata]